MKSKHSEKLLCLALLSLFIFGACMNAKAQGRGHSGMGSHGMGGHSGRGSHGMGGHSSRGSHGMGGHSSRGSHRTGDHSDMGSHGRGDHSGMGSRRTGDHSSMGSRGTGRVNKGSDTASEHSNGRSDRDMDSNSGSSMGRSGADMNRARKAKEHSEDAAEEMNEHHGMANGMSMSATQLRSGYQAALATNPNLKFGQYVAATRIAQNLGTRNPNITTDAILQGLASGKSLGQTLQGLGLSATQAKAALKTAHEDFEENEPEK